MINLILINSFICVGLYRAFSFEYKYTTATEEAREIDNDTKSIFWFWKYYVLDEIPYRISKPLGNCLTCMASVYSVIPYWAYHFDNVTWDVVTFYPFYILAVAGVNSIFDKYIQE